MTNRVMKEGLLALTLVAALAVPATAQVASIDYLGYGFETDGNPQTYSGGILTIYQDAATMANFASTVTFTDGTAVLVGGLTDLDRTMFTAFIGSVMGTVNWNGGTRLDDIAPWDQSGWTFLSGTTNRVANVQPGFDEQWDGKVEPRNPIVDTVPSSWGTVKALFD